ncbi:nucleotide exchange factor GrpE [Caldinitratiruptor microaerophilus]|uniref:Protein GrpE n=1 Tax=Caldinitratiruptor microaerophilus TaxID=671077 RepID=A0AA35G8U4_9FIRM|nr:nucleotide exchange factor GrpE [Caldinitratiruptor microaerophilus]BDG61431.1 hypothetical protein caldi_25210 [Caldinitratiruptor microaerophilus]
MAEWERSGPQDGRPGAEEARLEGRGAGQAEGGPADGPASGEAPPPGAVEVAGPAEPGGEPAADGPGAEVLRAELEAAREEARAYLERLARVQADYENYRRRAQREREETVQYANLNLLRELLPVLDNLERALTAANAEGATLESLRAGVEMIARQFREVLERAGLVAVAAEPGTAFDPHVHEAVLQVEGESEVATVVEELQKGYRLGERLVRPALVKVARRP